MSWTQVPPSASGTPLGKPLMVSESLTGSFLEAFTFLSGGFQSQAEEWDHLGSVAERRDSIRENSWGDFKLFERGVSFIQLIFTEAQLHSRH